MKHLTKKEKMALSPLSYKRTKLNKKHKNKNLEKKTAPLVYKKSKPVSVVEIESKKKEILLPLNEQQKSAFDLLLKTKQNVFLTGSAGTGKSYVIKRYLSECKDEVPVLATTGAAAVLVGGVTFHKFFGLGIADSEDSKVIEDAYQKDRVRKRILKATEIIIDEVSMLNPRVFELASEIAKKVKNNDLVFGGIRIVLTGDFFQLPPVITDERSKSLESKWVFNSETWQKLNLRCIELTQTVRTDNLQFIKILNKVRFGICDEVVGAFLNSRATSKPSEEYEGTVLYATKEQVENHNKKKLASVDSKVVKFKTEVTLANPNYKGDLFKDCPIPEVLYLKEGAIVMIRKNDPENRYVNGTIGRVKKLSSEKLHITTGSGSLVLEKENFEIKDGDGKVQATLTNFPVVLGWAITIHKSQGASLEYLRMDLSNLWEAGQAYVALSRAVNPKTLFIEKWSSRSIKSDSDVIKFYKKVFNS